MIKFFLYDNFECLTFDWYWCNPEFTCDFSLDSAFDSVYLLPLHILHTPLIKISSFCSFKISSIHPSIAKHLDSKYESILQAVNTRIARYSCLIKMVRTRVRKLDNSKSIHLHLLYKSSSWSCSFKVFVCVFYV